MVSQVDITPIALDGLYLLTVAGELDIATADRFIVDVVDWAASRPSDAPVVLDFSAVEFCGAAGLAALVQIESHLTPRHLRIRSPAPLVRRMIEIVGLVHLLEATTMPAVDQDRRNKAGMAADSQ